MLSAGSRGRTNETWLRSAAVAAVSIRVEVSQLLSGSEAQRPPRTHLRGLPFSWYNCTIAESRLFRLSLCTTTAVHGRTYYGGEWRPSSWRARQKETVPVPTASYLLQKAAAATAAAPPTPRRAARRRLRARRRCERSVRAGGGGSAAMSGALGFAAAAFARAAGGVIVVVIFAAVEQLELGHRRHVRDHDLATASIDRGARTTAIPQLFR